jgi:hypothetical protein
MTPRKQSARAVLLALAVLLPVLAALYASPYLALRQMRAAAAAHDAAGLARYVDVDAVRDSLKRGVRVRLLLRQRNLSGEPTPASAIGAAVAAALLGPMVDAAITPDSLARMLQGQRPADAATAADPGAASQTQMGYESPNRFVFSIKKPGDDEEPVDLVLRRDGVVGWKLAELRLP